MSPHSRREVALPVKVARCKKMAGSSQLDGRINKPEQDDYIRPARPFPRIKESGAYRDHDGGDDFHSDDEDSFTGKAAIL